MSSPERLRGRRSCGAVRFAVEDGFSYAMNCHCSGCRRATGSAFKPFAGIDRERLAVLEGGAGLTILGGADTHDARCGRCGSLLWSVVREVRWVHVALGVLEDAPAIRPSAHIFVGSKAPWFTITDGLPQHEAFG